MEMKTMSDIITITVNNDELHRLIVNAMADSDFVTYDRLENFIDRYDFESIFGEIIRDYDFDHIVEDLIDRYDFPSMLGEVISDYDFDHIIEDFLCNQGLDEDSITDLINDRIQDEIPEFMRGYNAEVNELIADLTALEDVVREQDHLIKLFNDYINKPSVFRRLLTNLYEGVAKIGLWRRGY